MSKLKDSYDAVIVGAGPSGSYTAYCCAKKGLKVLLVDKKSFPRKKPCGGIISKENIKRYVPFLENFASESVNEISVYFDYLMLPTERLLKFKRKYVKFACWCMKNKLNPIVLEKLTAKIFVPIS